MKQHTGLHFLLLSLPDYNSNNRIWNTCLDQLKENNQLESLRNLPSLFYDFHSESYIIIIVDGYIRKIKFELDTNSLSEEPKGDEYDDELMEGWKTYFENEKDDPFIRDTNIDAPTLLNDFKKYSSEDKDIKLEVYIIDDIIGLRIYKNYNKENKEWVYVCEKFEKTKYEKKIDINVVKILNNDFVILTNIGIFIFQFFHLKENYEIYLKYFHYIHQPEQNIKRSISKFFNYDKKSTLLLSDYNKLIDGWISYINNDKENVLKHGSKLLMFVIKLHDLKLIEYIYKKCLNYFKQDLENNKAFLSIITTSMPLLNKIYPEYVARYSSDTNMIIDSLDYKLEHLNTLHLYPFSKNFQLINLTRSIFLTKYQYQMIKLFENNSNMCFLILILYIIEVLIFILTLPISFSIFHILNYYHIINKKKFNLLVLSLSKPKFLLKKVLILFV